MNGVLSDRSIRETVEYGRLVIKPFNPKNVQPSTYDVTLGGDEKLILSPGVFRLARTAEWFELPDDIQGTVHGRSSIGRLGVLVHFTAGLLDPGFHGTITLECMALNQHQTFYPGDRIAQISFQWLDQPAERPYRGRYQGQRDVTESRFVHDQPAPTRDVVLFAGGDGQAMVLPPELQYCQACRYGGDRAHDPMFCGLSH